MKRGNRLHRAGTGRGAGPDEAAAPGAVDVLVYLTLVVLGIVIAVASLIFFVQARDR